MNSATTWGLSLALVLTGPGAVMIARHVGADASALPRVSTRARISSALAGAGSAVAPAASTRAPAPRRAFVGVVVPRQSANVAAPLPGRVVNVTVRIGDWVRKDAVLATLDSRLVAADLAAAEATARSQAAEYEIAQATRDVAAQHESRAQQLAAEGLVSAEDLLNRHKDHELAKLRVDSARAAVEQYDARAERLKREGELMVVRAPFDGMVVARYVEAGTAISATTLTPVVRLISADRLFIRFAVPAEAMAGLHQGSAVRAVSESGETQLFGRLERLAREMEASSDLAFAEASIERTSGEVISGLVVRVTTE